MSPNDFFVSQGGVLKTGALGEAFPYIANFGDYAAECDAFERAACLCAIGQLGLLRFSGADATSFLHNMLSTNVQKLAAGRGQLTSFCSPKGRMIASFFLWRDNESTTIPSAKAPAVTLEPVFYALLSPDLAAPVAKKLSLYVLRSKVKIENLSERYASIGVCGAKTRERASIFMEPPLNDGEVALRAGTFNVGMPSGRRLLVFPRERLEEYWKAGKPSLTQAGEDLWTRDLIMCGFAFISAATSDKLIPLEANFDALGGVDFNKGCYPGQEIIARTRYLGKLKTRLYIASCATAEKAELDAPLFGATFGPQKCGSVVNSAPDREGSIMLVALKTAAAQDELRLGSPDGAPVKLLPLPYELPSEEK
jgi:folate-binding protein YgfZ